MKIDWVEWLTVSNQVVRLCSVTNIRSPGMKSFRPRNGKRPFLLFRRLDPALHSGCIDMISLLLTKSPGIPARGTGVGNQQRSRMSVQCTNLTTISDNFS